MRGSFLCAASPGMFVVVIRKMTSLAQTNNEDSATPTPIQQRLLNDPLLARGRGALVMSQRRRERLVAQNQELKDYLKKHPWFGEIKGWERDIIRRMIFGLYKVGRDLEAQRLRELLFTIGDVAGKEPIWPILEHLLDGGVFVFESVEFSGPLPNKKRLPPVPLLPFLSSRVPEDDKEDRLVIIKVVLKHTCSQDPSEPALHNEDNPSKASSAVPPPQIAS